MTLPSKELDGLWESLQFDEPLQSTLLRAITRMVSFSSRKLNKWTINWNRLVLLWGPPGTGKTSFWHVVQNYLCSILVSKAIESVEILLEEEEDTFVYVFVDEVETLAARRERALAGSEPFDAVRAVNALLTGLDRLKHHCNVIVVCTSNLITALAFLDRVDIKQFIPHLSNRTIYGVYKECLEELSRCGIIGGASFDVVQVNPDDPFTALQYVESPTENLTIPSFDEMLLNYQMFADAVPKQLADAACESVGLSGRTIRRLPAMSLVMYGPSRVRYDVRTAIQALRTGIGSERKAKVEAQ
ncbi:hypothetical protein EYZ11_003380 [Aspergillus tanneri]|uniref:Uncharacterized protein n=1 Tax=Aspergillus tanneri TaxID=1220188 RepID=A0A4S3JQH8_9EURO|nr:hypothetical protein EYZ11_003380 [Aspergillus tanneri]